MNNEADEKICYEYQNTLLALLFYMFWNPQKQTERLRASKQHMLSSLFEHRAVYSPFPFSCCPDR